MEENIITYLRIRPVQDSEKIVECADEKSVVIARTKEMFSFEKVFDESKTSKQIFEDIGIQNIDQCFEGKNVCMFAYGQTSSGKTFTMKGDKENPGIIPSTINHIFGKMDNENTQLQIKVSFLEIYNETIIDLLNPKEQNIEIREHHSKGIYIQNLLEKVVTSKEEAEALYKQGEANRKFGETSQNSQSSRSHVIFRLNFEVRDSKNPTKTLQSVLNLIDLAGSENIGRSKTDKDTKTKTEGVNINKSLLALSNVINKLSQNANQYINYRDSKLTRLLQPCLGGNSRTIVICAVNPSAINYQETRDTLNFGKNAGAIKNLVNINEKSLIDKSSFNKEFIDVYQRENSELKVNIRLQFLNSNSQYLRENQLLQLNGHKQQQVEKNEELVKVKEVCIQTLQEQVEELTSMKRNHIEKIMAQNEELNDLRSEIMSVRKKNEDLKQNNLELTQIIQQMREKESKISFNLDSENEILRLKVQIEQMEENMSKMSQTYQLMQEEGLKLTNQTQMLMKATQEIEIEKTQLISQNKILNIQINDLQKKLSQKTTQNIISLPSNNVKNIFGNNLDKENINNGNQQEIIQRPDKFFMVDEKLEILQRESFSLSKQMQQNQQIEELHVQLTQAEHQLVNANYKINQLQQEVLTLKNLTNSSESKMNSQGQQRKSFISDCDSSLGDVIYKKSKRDEYNYIKKKIDTEVDSFTLKREIRSLNKRIKNLESLSETQRQKLQEKIEQIKWVNIVRIKLENRLMEHGLTTDNLLP